MRWLIAKLLYLPLFGLSLFAAAYFYQVIVAGQGITEHLGVFAVLFVALNAIVWVQNWLQRPRRRREKVLETPPRPVPLPMVEELPQAPAKPPERRFAMPPMAEPQMPVIAANAPTISEKLRRFVIQGDEAIGNGEEHHD